MNTAPDVCQQCIIDVLEENGFEPIQIDNWTINEVTFYYEDNIKFSFSGSYLTHAYAQKILQMFDLEHEFDKLVSEECEC